jgi:hypothetical protein
MFGMGSFSAISSSCKNQAAHSEVASDTDQLVIKTISVTYIINRNEVKTSPYTKKCPYTKNCLYYGLNLVSGHSEHTGGIAPMGNESSMTLMDFQFPWRNRPKKANPSTIT